MKQFVFQHRKPEILNDVDNVLNSKIKSSDRQKRSNIGTQFALNTCRQNFSLFSATACPVPTWNITNLCWRNYEIIRRHVKLYLKSLQRTNIFFSATIWHYMALRFCAERGQCMFQYFLIQHIHLQKYDPITAGAMELKSGKWLEVVEYCHMNSSTWTTGTKSHFFVCRREAERGNQCENYLKCCPLNMKGLAIY